MRQGRLIQSGTPEKLYKQPVDVPAARFFSDANEVVSRVRSGMAETPLGSFAVPVGFAAPEALVMIRPQGIRVAAGATGFEGYVLETRFQGDDVRCSILFKGIEDPVVARITSRQAPQRGMTGLFDIDPDHVLVFEKNPGDTM
jgi:iron(III) transport system ATP-binding protein